MDRDIISPKEKVTQLRKELAEHYKDDSFIDCTSMGELVRNCLRLLAEEIQQK